MADPIPIDSAFAKFAWEPSTGPVAFYRVCLDAHFGQHCWDTDVPYATVSRLQTHGGYPFTLTATAHRETMREPGPPSLPSEAHVLTVPEPSTSLLLLAGVVGLVLLKTLRRRTNRLASQGGGAWGFEEV